eukprot:gene18335-biopygen15973
MGFPVSSAAAACGGLAFRDPMDATQPSRGRVNTRSCQNEVRRPQTAVAHHDVPRLLCVLRQRSSSSRVRPSNVIVPPASGPRPARICFFAHSSSTSRTGRASPRDVEAVQRSVPSVVQLGSMQ